MFFFSLVIVVLLRTLNSPINNRLQGSTLRKVMKPKTKVVQYTFSACTSFLYSHLPYTHTALPLHRNQAFVIRLSFFLVVAAQYQSNGHNVVNGYTSCLTCLFTDYYRDIPQTCVIIKYPYSSGRKNNDRLLMLLPHHPALSYTADPLCS